MGIIENLKNIFGNNDVKEAENAVNPEVKDETINNSLENDSGWYSLGNLNTYYHSPDLSTDRAFSRIATVYACVDRRATTLAKLPYQVFYHDGDTRIRAQNHRLSYLLEVRPNRYQSPTAYKKYIVACQLLWGFACIYKKYNIRGEIEELIPWNPRDVGINKLIDYDAYVYTYKGKTYTEDEVIYIPCLSADGKRGKAPMTVAREAAESVLEMNKHLSGFYKSGAIKQGALKVSQPLSPSAKREMKRQWVELYGGAGSSGEPAVLDNGIEWEDISLPLADAQFIESKRLTAMDIAAVFNVPGSSVGLTSEKYSNLQEINDRFIQDVIAPDCVNIEEAHNYSCFLCNESHYYTKFNLAAGMRSDPVKRAQYYKEMLGLGIMTINEIRRLEELNGIGELGDKHYFSLNYTTLDTLEQHQRIKGGGDVDET